VSPVHDILFGNCTASCFTGMQSEIFLHETSHLYKCLILKASFVFEFSFTPDGHDYRGMSSGHTDVLSKILPVSPVHDLLFGNCILKSVVLPVSLVHDILFVSCILKSVVLSVSPVSPVHDILFGSCSQKCITMRH
jgi:hypothetical protein